MRQTEIVGFNLPPWKRAQYFVICPKGFQGMMVFKKKRRMFDHIKAANMLEIIQKSF